MVGCKPDSLSGCVGYWLLVKEDVPGGECVGVWLDVHMDGSACEAGCVETVIIPGADLVNLIPQLRPSALGKQGQPGWRFLVLVVY